MTRTARLTLQIAAATLFAAPALPARAAPSQADQALWVAVYKNDLAGAQAALAGGASPDVVNDDTFTDDAAKHYSPTPALELAMDRGGSTLAGLLVDRGADVNARDSYGYTPLLELGPKTPLAVIQKLIGRGADVNAVGYNKVPALTRACIFGRTDIARLLLARGASVDARGVGGATALMVAGCGGHLGLVKLLAAHGADVHARTAESGSALYESACTATDTVAVMQFLLRRGLDVNQRTADGSTPLQGAAYFGSVANVRFLLAHGADARARDRAGRTALTEAGRGREESQGTPSQSAQIVALLRAGGERQ